MTSRPRSGSSKPQTKVRIWEDPTRRNMLMNLGFGLAIVLAILTLLVAFAVSWYGDHLAPAVKVNDITLNMDDVARQAKVNLFLIDYQKKRTRTLLSAGQMWATDANGRISALDNEVSQVASLSARQLTDGTVMLELDKQNNLAVTPADIAQKQTDTATQTELRHLWMIEVSPKLDTGASTATDAQKAAAKAQANQAAQALKGGGDWATIAKNYSTDTATAPQGGDVGFIDKNSSLDGTFVTAIFAAQPKTATDVIEGSDGNYYIGKYTDTIAPVTDPGFAQAAKDAGLSQSDLDWSFQYAAANTKLQKWVVDQAMAPAAQRHVYRIFMQASANETGKDAVRVRHILFSPNNNAQAATTLAATDPAWDKAKAEADAAYAKLKADPTLFDSIARTNNDDTQSATNGGKLGYVANDGSMVQPFADAIFAKGLTPGQILAPVKSQYGYHVIQIMHYPTDADWASKLVTQATSLDVFKTLARDNSDDPESSKGGDMGWIGAHTYQISDALATAIFAAPVGKVSTVTTNTDGTYIFWIAAEENRAPTGDQATFITANAFNSWYTPQRAKFVIWQDPSFTSSSTQ
jgi:parvulin-like peptidyl-prolyl isomerase